MKPLNNTTLKEARLHMGLRQKDMGLILGMRQGPYSKIETGYTGRKPTKQHTIAIFILEYLYSEGLLQKMIDLIKTQNKLSLYCD